VATPTSTSTESGKQYFVDLAALACLRTATPPTVKERLSERLPSGVRGVPGADRQWLAVYDPAPACTQLRRTSDPSRSSIWLQQPHLRDAVEQKQQHGRRRARRTRLNYVPATKGTTSVCPTARHVRAVRRDGYPQIDQVTGKVFQAAGFNNSDGTYSMLLNIGNTRRRRRSDVPRLSGEQPCGDKQNLIHIADNLNWPPDTLFSVLSIDSARNLVRF